MSVICWETMVLVQGMPEKGDWETDVPIIRRRKRKAERSPVTRAYPGQRRPFMRRDKARGSITRKEQRDQINGGAPRKVKPLSVKISEGLRTSRARLSKIEV